MRLKGIAFARWSAAFNFALGICDTAAPALAAFLVAHVGMFSVATFDALCCVFAAWAVVNAPHWLDTPLVHDPDSKDDDVETDDEKKEISASAAGEASQLQFWKWLLSQKLLMILMFIFMWSNAVFAQVSVLLPIMLQRRYSLVAIGSVLSVSYLGLLFGSFVFGASARLSELTIQRPMLTVLLGVIAQGALVSALVVEPGAMACTIGGFVYHVLDQPIGVAAGIIINRDAPQHMQGRFSSARLLLATIGMPLAHVLNAPMAGYFGLLPLLFLLGASKVFFCLVVIVLGWRD